MQHILSPEMQTRVFAQHHATIIGMSEPEVTTLLNSPAMETLVDYFSLLDQKNYGDALSEPEVALRLQLRTITIAFANYPHLQQSIVQEIQATLLDRYEYDGDNDTEPLTPPINLR